MRAPTGSTRLVAVIGSPIAHSLSPVLFNAAFEAAGLEWVDVALEVAAGDTARALDGMRALGIVGLSVTTPHKEAAAALCDALSPEAELLGAVNCIHNVDGVLTGHTTDGDGLVAAVRIDHDFRVAGRRCVVLGAGGAAASVVLALVRAGAASVTVVNRTRERADRLVALVGGSAAALHAGQLVVDIVYRPLETALLRAAAARGAATSNGVSMLVHQAALQFEIWTGAKAPVDAMTAAVAPLLRVD